MENLKNPNNFKLKDICVGIDCKNKLPMTFKYFKKYGNFCMPCDREMNEDIREGRGVRSKLVEQGLINDNII